MMVTRLSETVAGSRPTTSCMTGAPEKIDVPKLPRRMFHAQMPNCTGSGSSRPSWWLIMSICAGLALSPAMIAAGLPGARCTSRNTITPTIAITTRVEPRRRAM